jgi:hypothetical protein
MRVEAGFRQFELQCSGLLLGKAPDGRASTDDGVMMLNLSGAGCGNQLGLRLAADAGEGKINNVGVAEEIKKKGFYGFQRIGPAELKQNYPYAPCCLCHPPGSPEERGCYLNRDGAVNAGSLEIS